MKLIKENHNVHQLGVHIVFCTKFRHKIFEGKKEIVLKYILGETCIEYGWLLQEIEIMPDHVHLFLQVKPTDRLVDVVKTLKSISAVKMFSEFKSLKGKKFWGSGLWSRGTYYGGVGQVNEKTIEKYIREQKSK